MSASKAQAVAVAHVVHLKAGAKIFLDRRLFTWIPRGSILGTTLKCGTVIYSVAGMRVVDRRPQVLHVCCL
jgi:hypothetical protein